ncbi:MAG: ATP-binding protein [Blastocatellia bacterium]|nr:ATP-binding protein [Blastocatellia bacterium]MCS7158073.1 ATP-binding protein [Blastocatellia bacterium]MDW8168586.1 ATP-binding protein [Acidobacteriota bacterium]
MEDLSLHILDIVENALRAGARNVIVRLSQSKREDRLILEIIDDGEGMDEETVSRSLDPFFTTKEGKRIGLGLPLLAQAAEEAEGKVYIKSAPGKGTTVTAIFRLSHIDRKPLGNIEETVRCLRRTHPEVRFHFESVNAD